MDKVRNYLKKYNMADKIIEFSESTATVELAAKALNCEEGRIAKSLSFKLKDKNILIVTAGDVKIDNSKYRNEFNEKAKMLNYDEVLNIIGHPVGGVCPFAVNEDVEIYLDESLNRFKTVFPACGSSHNAIEISPLQLAEITNCIRWIDVTKNK